MMASPQRTFWENWFHAAGHGLVKAMACCPVESNAVTVPGSHGPDSDESCTPSREECAVCSSEASVSAFVL